MNADRTERLFLRPLSVDDAPALHVAYRDAELMRWWSSGPHASVEETAAYLAPRADHPDWRGWAMALSEGGPAIGTLAASIRRPSVAEIGYLLARDYWGRGYACEGVAWLLRRLFKEEGCRRVYADTDPENEPSSRLLAAFGFRVEGRLRDEWETHLGVRDSLIWGLLRPEWRG